MSFKEVWTDGRQTDYEIVITIAHLEHVVLWWAIKESKISYISDYKERECKHTVDLNFFTTARVIN